jgi:hypothetical protein
MAARLGSTTSARAQQWERSGLTLQEFGEQRGIARTTLVWWRHAHGRQSRPPASERAPADAPPVFRELQLAGPAPLPAPALLEVVLHSGHVLRIPSGLEATTLRAVIAALAGAR